MINPVREVRDFAQAALVVPVERDQPGVDVGLGPEHPPADVAGAAGGAVPGGLHRRDAVGGAAGPHGGFVGLGWGAVA